jgi:hypothetical protein
VKTGGCAQDEPAAERGREVAGEAQPDAMPGTGSTREDIAGRLGNARAFVADVDPDGRAR